MCKLKEVVQSENFDDNPQLKRISNAMADDMDKMNGRMDKMNTRLESVENKVDIISKNQDELKVNQIALKETVLEMLKAINRIEINHNQFYADVHNNKLKEKAFAYDEKKATKKEILSNRYLLIGIFCGLILMGLGVAFLIEHLNPKDVAEAAKILK